MTTFDSGTARTDLAEDDLEVLHEVDALAPPTGCVVCDSPIDEPGCCSFTCVRAARRQRDKNLARLRALHSFDGPADTRARLTERNGQLTAALMGWRQ